MLNKAKDSALLQQSRCERCNYRCQAAVEAAWQRFRDGWADLHPLSTARRVEALAQLQPLAELQVIQHCALLPGLAVGRPPLVHLLTLPFFIAGDGCCCASVPLCCVHPVWKCRQHSNVGLALAAAIYNIALSA